MRTSFSRVTMMVTVIASLAAFAVTGCQTTNSSKLSSPSWFSWGKKKPAATTLGASSKPGSNLPAPPSGGATPNPAPSYAGAGGSRAGASTGMAANSNIYGSQNSGQNPYANASYPTNPNAAAGRDNLAAPSYGRNSGNPGPSSYAGGGYPENSPNTSAPAYGPQYNSRNQGYGNNAALPNAGQAPGAYAGAAGTPPSGAYGQGANPSAGPERSQAWGGNYTDNGAQRYGAPPANDSSSRSFPTANGGQRFAQGYGQDNGAAAPADSGARGAAAGSSGPAANGYGGGGYAPAGGAFGQSRNPQGASYADNRGGRNDAGAAANASPYRPGTTNRPTPYRDGQQINVPGADNVQSASFNTSNEASSRASISDRNPADAGAEYAPGQRTATGSNYPGAYPSTYAR